MDVFTAAELTALASYAQAWEKVEVNVAFQLSSATEAHAAIISVWDKERTEENSVRGCWAEMELTSSNMQLWLERAHG